MGEPLTARPEKKKWDWLSEPDQFDLTPFQNFVVNEVDWTRSPLGPIKGWSRQLIQMVLLVMADPLPAVVYWGDDNTIVYNEPYIHLIGSKHPALQGQDPKIEFAEIWDHFEALLSTQKETATTTVEANAPLLLHRHGFLEETYFSWKFVPIIGPDGTVIASHATVVETTREVISDRRLSTVRGLSRNLAEATSIKELWTGLMSGLENSPRDIPLALLYSVADVEEASRAASPNRNSVTPSLTLLLEASIGVDAGHAIAPQTLDLDLNQSCFSQYFRLAMDQMSIVCVAADEEMHRSMTDIKWRGFDLPSNTFVVCPIIPTNSGKMLACLVIALNPRRPYDDDYRNFIHLLTQQVTTPQLSAVILRAEVERRAQHSRQEAIDRERLSKELSEAETKFARFSVRAPIGLAILTVEGFALSANEHWKALTTLEVGSPASEWERVLAAGEAGRVNVHWTEMVQTRKPISLHTKVHKPWRAPDLDLNGNEIWLPTTDLLLNIYPDLNEDGEISTIMSCVTDISGLKYSEAQLERRMNQAIELKKQQERFIDMTSHEMRNPLSALIGCADEIVTCLKEYRRNSRQAFSQSSETIGSPMSQTSTFSLLDEAMEAADTIIYCAMHQKRIIDDILTLSRLDSNLLLVSPEAAEPIQLVRGALKMFEAETKRADVRLELVEQTSLTTLDVQWTLLDPSRVLQVLINLLTNAIKFTRTEEERHVTIILGASLSKPSEDNEWHVEYVARSSKSQDQTARAEWGTGEVIYLSITVKDTGRGLAPREISNLFHLFKQASPKTYTQYGGSGLGLFISRQLVEMQGGEIGVASEEGKGSIFTFYIKTRRTKAVAMDGGPKDFQLTVRDDALREACAVEIPASQNGSKMPNVIPERLRARSPRPPPSSALAILVVEDNLVNQKVVSKQLRKEGHMVSVANHGEEALDFLRRSVYWNSNGETSGERLSIVLMDLEMPVMDGLTCVRKIREKQVGGDIKGHIPVIAVTANARKDQILDCLEAGMDDVTTKPYRIKDMLKQIEKLVSKHTPPS